MNKKFKVLTTLSLLVFSIAYIGKVAAETQQGAGYNAKLIEKIVEPGGFNEESYQNGGFNDKNPEKEVKVGWKKH